MKPDNFERLVIGTVLLEPSEIRNINLTVDDFSSDVNKLLWGECLELSKRDALSVKMLIEKLRSEDVLDSVRVGDLVGEEAIYEIMAMGDPLAVEEASKIVLEASMKRMLERIGRDITIMARNGISADDLIETSLKKIMQVRRTKTVDARSILEEYDRAIEIFKKYRNGEIKPKWMPALRPLRKLIGGVDSSEFIIMVAKTGSGKSSYMRWEAMRAAENGYGVLTITMENTKIETVYWAIANRLGLDYAYFKDPRRFRDETVRRVEETREYFEKLPWYIEEMGFSDIGNIIDLCRRTVMNKNISLIQLDGMYLIEENGNGRYESISETAQKLRSLAQELNVPIIATTQFSRRVAQKNTPEITDLLYAGENAARQVWSLEPVEMTAGEASAFPENMYRNILLPKENYKVVKTIFNVLKNTGGPTGKTAPFYWYKHINDFREVIREEES
ncbi:MAG: DnaB-like helicase C-terminal domain-containing protein [Candidatus Methanomethylicaceae archaeon]